jgi:hypothetical protein
MLERLEIHHYALIEDSVIEFLGDLASSPVKPVPASPSCWEL